MRDVFKLDRSFLVELGLGHLDDHQQRHLLERIHKVLEVRTGHIISSSLTNAQLDTFYGLIKEDPERARQFLERTVPHYAVVTRSELDFIARSIVQSIRQGTVAIGDSKPQEQIGA